MPVARVVVVDSNEPQGLCCDPLDTRAYIPVRKGMTGSDSIEATRRAFASSRRVAGAALGLRALAAAT